MLFNSKVFIVFLVLVLLVHHLLGRGGKANTRTWFLLGASVFFYGWYHPPSVLLLLASTVICYVVGIKLWHEDDPAVRWRWAGFAIAFELSCLCFFKYANMALTTVGQARNAMAEAGLPVSPVEVQDLMLDVFLPVGISFYVFKSIGYVVSLYKRELPPAKSFQSYALYVSYFPQLNAGPVEKATHLLPQIEREPYVRREWVYEGVFLILLGYIKKVVIADWIAEIIDPFYATPIEHGPTAVLVMFLFTLQIYADFSAYSDIAIGIGRLMGYHIRPNFNLPFVVPSISERWRRWHISMSVFFKEHIYIPLGGSRKGEVRTQLNVMLVMLFSGFWHGASWNFVIWGLLNGVSMIGQKMLRPRGLRQLQGVAERGGRVTKWLYYYLCCLVTYWMISMINIYFRSPNFEISSSYVKAIFGSGLGQYTDMFTLAAWQAVDIQIYNGLNVLFWVVLAHEIQRWWDVQSWLLDPKRRGIWAVVCAAMLWSIVAFGVKGGQFIYFQF